MSYLLVFGAIRFLIILHELGRFLAARRMGIPIARFSVGFGRKLWGCKIGQTEYWLSLIPCGGYVGLSFVKLLHFSALLNVNLAIFNLIPILPLDGGKIVMGVLRKIHQPLRKLELPLTVGGWALLMALTLYATALDISRVAHGVLG